MKATFLDRLLSIFARNSPVTRLSHKVAIGAGARRVGRSSLLTPESILVKAAAASAAILLAVPVAQAQTPVEPVPTPAPQPTDAVPPPAPPVAPAPAPAPLEAQPAPDPAPIAAEPAPLPAPAATPPAADAEEPALPDRLSVGKSGGFWQPSGLLQSWLFFDKTQDTDMNSTFRLRRAEITVKGEIAPKLVGYLIRIDAAKLLAARSIPVTGQDPAPTTPGSVSVLQPSGTDGSILQDFWISFLSDYADVSVGQFKIPVSLEALQSSARLLFPERSLVTRQYGDRRELGVKIEKKLGDYFYYYAGLFNGSNVNRLDNDKEKDIGLRLEAYPVKGLTIGAVGYTTALGDREEAVRDRLEADVRFEGAGLIVQGEFIKATDGPESARLEGQGAYGAAAYTFIDRIQPAVRIGFLDTNTENDDAGKRLHYEGCINYFLRSWEAKIALSVAHFVPDPEPDFTEITLLTQVGF